MIKQKQETRRRDFQNTVTLVSTARISKKHVRKLTEVYDCAEYCFIDELCQCLDDEKSDELECQEAGCETINDGDAAFCKACGKELVNDASDLPLNDLIWYGDDSGDSFYDVFVKKVVPHVIGRLEAIIILDNPASEESVDLEGHQLEKMFGVIIEDGSYTECDVSLSFSPRARQHS